MSNIWLPYTQMLNAPEQIRVKSAHGSTLILEDGRTLLDAVGSWWTSCHGYQHPKLIEALKKQADTLAHVMLGGLMHTPLLELTEALSKILPSSLKHPFYSESGSVAVEVAMKMATQYWLNQEQKRPKFIYLQHAYHGDTFYTMSVCDPETGMHAHINPLLPQHTGLQLPKTAQEFSTLDHYLTQHHGEYAGFIVEPLVQGAGGMKFSNPNLLKQTCELMKKHKLLVIFDEIFTGFGRTGTLFACEQVGFVPDILCLGKGITGGVTPFSITIANATVYDQFLSCDSGTALMHASTYAGHALGAAVACASLEIFATTPWQSQVHTIEETLLTGLEACKDLPGVKEVRALGAIGVVEMEYDLAPYMSKLRAAFIEQGVWCRPFGNIIYTTPNFNINSDELHFIIQSIRQVLSH